jgi:hypothetical protein
MRSTATSVLKVSVILRVLLATAALTHSVRLLAEDRTEAQQDALNNAMTLASEFEGLDDLATSILSLSTLGGTVCTYDRPSGTQILARAHEALQRPRESKAPPRLQGEVLAQASRCNQQLAEQIRSDIASTEHGTDASLAAARKHLADDPTLAADMMQSVADSFPSLSEAGVNRFLSSLSELRYTSETTADQLFSRSLQRSAAIGSLTDVFALGNYLFGPTETAGNAIGIMPLADGTAYVFNAMRPDANPALISTYLDTAARILNAPFDPDQQLALRYALSSQLLNLSSQYAPQFSQTIDLAVQSDSTALTTLGRFQNLSARLGSLNSTYFRKLESELQSTASSDRRAELVLILFASRIYERKYDDLGDLLNYLEPKSRSLLTTLVEFYRTLSTLTDAESQEALTLSDAFPPGVHRLLLDLEILALSLRGRPPDRRHDLYVNETFLADLFFRVTATLDTVPISVRPNLRAIYAQSLLMVGERDQAYRSAQQVVLDFNASRQQETRVNRSKAEPLRLTATDNALIETITLGSAMRSFRLDAPTAPSGHIPALVAALAASRVSYQDMAALIDPIVDDSTRSLCEAAAIDAELRSAFSQRSEQ